MMNNPADKKNKAGAISAAEKTAYGLGGLGKNIAYTFVATYTLYYYNSVLGISASFIGTLLMIARIFDAFNDPFMGVIAARSRSRFGKYSPWIFSGALLNSLVMAAMFNVPYTLDSGGIKLWFSVSYLLCGITYTISDIPYWAVIPAMTFPGRERENMTVLARTFSGIGSGIPIVFTMLLVTGLGGNIGRDGYRTGFGKLAVLVSVVYTLLTLITILKMPREKNDISAEPVPSVGLLFKNLTKNDQAIILSVIIILFYSATNLTMNLVIYIFDHDIGDPGLYTPFMAMIGGAQLLAMVVAYPLLRKKLSNYRIFSLGCITTLAGYFFLTVMSPLPQYSFVLLCIPCILVAFGNGIAYVLITVFISNAVEYGERKTGRRDESMVSSLQTLMVKISAALSVLLSGIGIDILNFSNDIPVQSASSIKGLHLLFAFPSLILVSAALIITLSRKDL